MLKQIVENLKELNVNPYDIEMIYKMDNTDSQDGELLSDQEYQELISHPEQELKETIFEVYYNSETPELPENIKELIHQAKTETSYADWALILDWLEGANDFSFDKEMYEYTYVNSKANKAYGYMLSLEINN